MADHHNALIGMLVDGLAHSLTEFTRVRSSQVGLLTTSCLLTQCCFQQRVHYTILSLLFSSLGQYNIMSQSFRHPQVHTEYAVS